MKKVTTQDKALNYVRALLYGESGIGKTTSLAALPEDRTLIAASERSLIPLRHKSYEVLMIESWQDVRELLGTMQKPYLIGDKPASMLAIDSLSEFSEMCKRQIVEVDRKALMADRSKGKTDKPGGIYDDLMTMEDWGLYRNRMASMISAFCHLPIHIIFTCLSDRTEDKGTGKLFTAPGLNGKIALECPAHFDLVMFMRASTDGEGKPTRVWQTYNDGQIIAKDSAGVLDPFEQPSWTGVFKKIMAKKTKPAAVHASEAQTQETAA